MEAGAIVWNILAIIGAIKIACNILPWLYWKLFCSINLKNYQYGYVLITGASDGIGKSLSKEFARRGFKVLMISRNLEKLSLAKQEIQTLHPQSTIEIIQSDFTHSHKDPESFYASLHDKIQKFEVSILINNVGIAKSSSLSNLTFEDIENMIGVNTYPSTFITHKLIPVMLNRYRETQKRSLIINFSSVVDETLTPGSSVYAATKRFNAFFGEGLRYEYKDIDFSVVKPGPVMTQMLVSNEFTSIPMIVQVDDYVKALIGGLRSGVNHGHWKHKLMGGLSNTQPYLITIGFIRLLMPWAVKKGLIR